MALSAVADFIGASLVDCTLSNYKRMHAIRGCLGVTVIFAFSYLYFPLPKDCKAPGVMCMEKYAWVAFSTGIKVFINLLLGVMYVYMAELFPS